MPCCLLSCLSSSEMIKFKQSDIVEQRNSPLDTITKTEKGHGRIEKRTAVVTHEVEWLENRDKWAGLQTIGTIKTDFGNASNIIQGAVDVLH